MDATLFLKLSHLIGCGIHPKNIMKTKLFYIMIFCSGLLVGCDKEQEVYEPIKPPIEEPEEPAIPSTKDIIKTKKGDINMIVGTNNWYIVRYCNGKYIAAGVGGYITSSSDGINWTTPKSYGFDYCHDVTYGNGKYIVVGSASNSSFCQFSTSNDGINWTTAKPFNTKNTGIAHCIAYGNNKFVAICGTEYISSSDGVNWKYGGSINTIYKMAYINGKYVAGGGNGYIYVSNNGDTWNTYKITTSGYLNYAYGVAYGNGNYVVLFEGGEIAVSSDGANWSKIDKIGSSNNWTDLSFNNNTFVAVNGNREAAISFDGINWKQPFKIADFYIRSIAIMD